MRGLAVSVVMVLAAGDLGCLEVPASPPPGELEIGQRGPNDEFVPLANGGTAWIVLAAGGLNFLSLSLRAEGIDPNRPDPHIEVTVSDILLAQERHERPEMLPDGDGHILWDLMVPFVSELCCFVCRDGLIDAHLADRLGRRFRGQVTVLLARGECPDPSACCYDDWCPDGLETQLCE